MTVAIIMIIVFVTLGIIEYRKTKKIDNLILKTKAASPEIVFNIYWTQPLTMAQKNLIATRMISKFSPACRPSSIRVSDVAQIVFQTPCMTESQLTNIGNSFMADNHENNTVSNVVKVAM